MNCENCRLKNLCKYTEAFSSLVENVHKVACDDNLENVVDVVVKCKFFEQNTPTAKFTVTDSKLSKEGIDEYLKIKGERSYIDEKKPINRTPLSEDSILYNASQDMAKFVQQNMSENKNQR